MLDVNLKLAPNALTASDDYNMVRDVIEAISQNWRERPCLEDLAKNVGRSPTQMQKTFTRWAGLSPKDFLQAVTLDHAKRLLAQDLPLLETSLELGLSGPSRLHDLFITHEAMSPGAYKSKGKGVEIVYGFHDCQFGRALIMATLMGMAGMAFCDDGEEEVTLEDMKSRWPNADFSEDVTVTTRYAVRSFQPSNWQENQPLRIVLIGTDFEIKVWEGLMKIPLGTATTYSALATKIGRRDAPRAVGRAVGRNPLSFVVPCHRVVGKTGDLTGYHWGITRKRAMLGWEAGQLASG